MKETHKVIIRMKSEKQKYYNEKTYSLLVGTGPGRWAPCTLIFKWINLSCSNISY